jgi:hypothetical protein
MRAKLRRLIDRDYMCGHLAATAQKQISSKKSRLCFYFSVWLEHRQIFCNGLKDLLETFSTPDVEIVYKV